MDLYPGAQANWTNDADECQLLCQNTAGCGGFTFTPVVGTDSVGWCTLKSVVAEDEYLLGVLATQHATHNSSSAVRLRSSNQLPRPLNATTYCSSANSSSPKREFTCLSLDYYLSATQYGRPTPYTSYTLCSHVEHHDIDARASAAVCCHLWIQGVPARA